MFGWILRKMLGIPKAPSTSGATTPGAGKRGYSHEMTDAEHEDLARLVSSLEGMVVVSRYPSPLYDDLYSGWKVYSRAHRVQGGAKRTEVVWINRAAEAAKTQVSLAI